MVAKNRQNKSLPPSDTFYLRHSEHQAHLWQGETSKWSFAMGLFLIAAEPIRQHKMLHKPEIHTKLTMWIVFFGRGTDELDVRKDNTRHFSTPPVLPEGLEIAAVAAAGGVWRHLKFLVVLTHQIKQPSGRGYFFFALFPWHSVVECWWEWTLGADGRYKEQILSVSLSTELWLRSVKAGA